MIYFDHSATTPIHLEVAAIMDRITRENFGNPSSIHRFGQKARSLVERARKQIADSVGCSPLEIIFTGGGTEANNLVLWNQLYEKKKHVITSAIEHPAIHVVLKNLKNFGITYSISPVDRYGCVQIESIKKLIRPDTGLISIMFANNEIGSLQPIQEIGELAKSREIRFHSDAVQIPGKITLDISKQLIDYMSFSAHKFYGPKGVGALYIKKGHRLRPLILGGGQEMKMRAGTENVPGIVGIGLAAELAAGYDHDLLIRLASRLKSELTQKIPNVVFNGHPDHHLPGLVSVSFKNTRSDILLIKLDINGFAVSSGSACSSGTVKPSHVLKAMGISDNQNTQTLRISFGKDNTMDEVSKFVEVLSKIVSESQHYG